MKLILKNGREVNVKKIVKELRDERLQYNINEGIKVFGYRLFGKNESLLNDRHYKAWNINGKYILIADVKGFNYIDKVRVNIDEGFRIENPKEITAEPGIYLFLIYSCNFFTLDVSSQELCAMISICLGPNVIHNSVFESFYYMKSTGMITKTPINMEKYKIESKVNYLNIDQVKCIDTKIANLDRTNKARIEMSLRWYNKAIFEKEIVDGFISYWIALETVIKEKGSDISIIKNTLKNIYGEKVMEENKEFQVGILFGIRSAILHNGKSKELPSTILGFLRAMYIDLLYYILDLKTGKKLIKFQSVNKLDLSEYTVKQNWQELDHLL